MSLSSITPATTAVTATPLPTSVTAGTIGAKPLTSAPVEATGRAQRTGEPNREALASGQGRSSSSPEDLQKTLEEVQSAINVITNDLQFSIDEDTGKTLIKIVDRETDEVIKQIPSEELLRISKALDTLKGLLVKQEV